MTQRPDDRRADSTDEVPRHPARPLQARATCPPTAGAPSPTSTTPGSPTPMPSGPRRSRCSPRRTAWTPPPSPRCCGWRTTSSALAGGLLDAPDGFAGSVTSGGTESILLAVLAAREGAPEIDRPEHGRADDGARRVPQGGRTTSACALVLVDVDPDTLRADPAAMAAAIDDTTVLVVASAPSYAHGVVDPVPEIAALAAGARHPLPRRRLHRRLGAAAPDAAPPVDLRRRGRHERQRRPAQVRLHPEGRLGAAAPHRRPAPRPLLRLGELARLHDAQQHDAVDPLRRPARRGLGRDHADRRRGVRRPRPAGARRHPRARGGRSTASPACACWRRPTRPSSPWPPTTRCDVFTIADEMLERGWFVQPQLSLRRPAADAAPHAVGRDGPVGARPGRGDLRESVGAARAAGPVGVDPGLAALASAHRPRDPRRRRLRGAARRRRARRATTARSRSRSGWRRSTPCSTPARPPCARRCCSACSTACRAPPAPEAAPQGT